MRKKDSIYKWDEMEKNTFANIKQAFTDALELLSLDYGRYFLLYTLTYD